MRLLVVGGAGFVGSMVLPHLAERHQIRVFDRRAPAPGGWESVPGSLDDFDVLSEAARGCDAMLFMAMNAKEAWGELPTVVSAYDVNVKGLHLAHWAAHEAGIRRVVVTSSLSVYAPRGAGERYPTEETPPDGDDFYGFTKRLGEQVSQQAARRFGQTVISLRLCFPWPDLDPAPTAGRPSGGVTGDGVAFRAATFTRARDVASAILLALEHEHTGWQAFAISGDPEQRVVPTGKARRVLGWKPTQEER
ncbi:MAG: NAD-dependent epimerase/dehydratase family protein [Candidatus Dormibacteraceae bacterium]